MPPTVFEPEIPAGDRVQTHALDRSASSQLKILILIWYLFPFGQKIFIGNNLRCIYHLYT